MGTFLYIFLSVGNSKLNFIDKPIKVNELYMVSGKNMVLKELYYFNYLENLNLTNQIESNT